MHSARAWATPLAMVFIDKRWALGAVWEGLEGDIDGRWPMWLGARAEFYFVTTRWVHLSVGDVLGMGSMVKTTDAAGPGTSFLVVQPDVTIVFMLCGSCRF